MPSLPEPHAATVSAIYKHYEVTADRRDPIGLGPSSFGNECDAALWYGFRWVHDPKQWTGRMLRLFETGNREEWRMLDNLEAIGVRVKRVDPETGKQWEFFSIGGHFIGHMDGLGTGFQEAPVNEHVLEFKTHNDKSWKDVVAKGVEKSKPGHFAQMQLYMHLSGRTRAFYMAHNKNSDELYQERFAYDSAKAAGFMARADRIINSATPPPRLHNNPHSKLAFVCNDCPAFGICHGGQFARRNCRTCLHSTPVEGGWHCAKLNAMLSFEAQQKGCDQHLYIPALVPGKQIDADEAIGVVTYQLRNGSEWRDGA